MERGIEQGQGITILGDLIWKSAESFPILSEIKYIGKSKIEILKKLKRNIKTSSFYLAISSAVFLVFCIALFKRLQIMTFIKIKNSFFGRNLNNQIEKYESEEIHS